MKGEAVKKKIFFRVEVQEGAMLCLNMLGIATKGDVIENRFATKTIEGVDAITSHNDRIAFEYDGGGAWQTVLIIESSEYIEDKEELKKYKCGHNDETDKDEVFIIKGNVLKRINYNDHKWSEIVQMLKEALNE